MPADRKELATWLAVQRAPLVGSATFLRLLRACPDLSDLFTLANHELRALRLTDATINYLRQPDWSAVEKDINWLETSPQHHVVLISDASYPPLLKEIPDPPPLLFVRGNLGALQDLQLAIVGTRHPTAPALQTATQFAEFLSCQGFVITSGLALGIDAAGHRGAIKAGGMTIGVAGTGVDRIYPRQHLDLAHEIIAKGAIISEYPLGTPPAAQNFPRRNRIISGLAVGVLVVEAALQSGSLITAKMAMEQGREVFAIPGSIHNPASRGCHALIKQGAKLVENADDIFEELSIWINKGTSQTGRVSNVSSTENLSEELRTVLSSMGFEPITADSIVEVTGLTAEEVSSILLELELHNHVAPASGGRYVRRM